MATLTGIRTGAVDVDLVVETLAIDLAVEDMIRDREEGNDIRVDSDITLNVMANAIRVNEINVNINAIGTNSSAQRNRKAKVEYIFEDRMEKEKCSFW